ncbi:MAG: DNA polymerase beta superfamily protein [Fluviicola sp.]
MTLEELKKSGAIIFECISGSRAYGLATATSDTDIRGVYIAPISEFYSLEHVEQINNETNDIVYYELRKFIELCANNNPNILELLNVSEECILYKHPIFDQIKVELFLSKKCEASFGNYAFTQIKKAYGLEKKILNPIEKERKSILDFCFVLDEGKSIPFIEYALVKKIDQFNCGLASVPHMRDCFNLFYSESIPYKGVAKSDLSNEVSLSEIPKGEKPIALLFFNKDGYSTYCKKYREYWDWVDKRNEARYENTIEHGKNYDSKNMMHTFRLLHMAKEIALEGKINVKRPDRDYLLRIKAGEFEYEDLVNEANRIKYELSDLYEKSSLPELPNREKINELLVNIRKEFYNQSN